jgi:AcrR family transcriptional regulator
MYVMARENPDRGRDEGRRAGRGGRRPRPADTARGEDREAIRQFVAEVVAEELNRTAGRAAEHLNRKTDRVTERLARKAEQVDERLGRKVDRAAGGAVDPAFRGGAALPPTDMWLRREPTGRRPRFSRERIAEVAVAIADAEGIEALSMRRLAGELDAGTMTLYHYVRTKDELFALIHDAIMAEVVVPPGELPATWREAMTVIAQRTCDVFLRHPWAFDIDTHTPPGPHSMRHFDQSLQAVASLRGSLADQFDVIFAVDEYVFGHCLSRRRRAAGTDPAVEDFMPHYVEELARSGEYPRIGALVAERGMAGLLAEVSAAEDDDDRFARNLARLLDGLAHAIER